MRQETGDRPGNAGRLVHLSESDRYEVPDGEPDVRGWTVRTADGRKVGKVEDLLVDTGEGRIRYLEVELASEARDESGREYALIPVGTARLDEKEDDVVVDDRVAARAGMPKYDRKKFSRDYERSLRTYYEGDRRESRDIDQDADFYTHPTYDERSFFGTRRRGREERPYLVRRAD